MKRTIKNLECSKVSTHGQTLNPLPLEGFLKGAKTKKVPSRPPHALSDRSPIREIKKNLRIRRETSKFFGNDYPYGNSELGENRTSVGMALSFLGGRNQKLGGGGSKNFFNCDSHTNYSVSQ